MISSYIVLSSHLSQLDCQYHCLLILIHYHHLDYVYHCLLVLMLDLQILILEIGQMQEDSIFCIACSLALQRKATFPLRKLADLLLVSELRHHQQ